MSNVTLCGIAHKEGGNVYELGEERTFIHPIVQPVFDLRIVPQITAGTVVILESINFTADFTDPRFDDLLWSLGDEVFRTSRPARFVGCDPRGGSARAQKQTVADVLCAEKAVLEKVSFHELPGSYDELLASIRSKNVSYSLIAPLTKEEKGAVQRTRNSYLSFDAFCVRRIKENSESDRLVIAGLNHCLRLHVQHGWDLEFLIPKTVWSPQMFGDMYKSFFVGYLWTP